ncbi:hypothetical protein [Thermomonas sp.]|uniref:hypothetical protein n=1 Tax=Thermomonas sp. TaxID=1971895 RepID=UPI003D144178
MTTSAKVENCHFKFQCNRDWDDLFEIELTPDIRYCDDCDHLVYLCSRAELEEHARKGHCVALPVEEGTHIRRHTVGAVAPPEELRPLRELLEPHEPRKKNSHKEKS